jgi:hypothetical protein
MTDTFVDSKVQRIQAMLYANASRLTILPRAVMKGKPSSPVRQWGDGETH